jgi:hypothetical protein
VQSAVALCLGSPQTMPGPINAMCCLLPMTCLLHTPPFITQWEDTLVLHTARFHSTHMHKVLLQMQCSGW